MHRPHFGPHMDLTFSFFEFAPKFLSFGWNQPKTEINTKRSTNNWSPNVFQRNEREVTSQNKYEAKYGRAESEQKILSSELWNLTIRSKEHFAVEKWLATRHLLTGRDHNFLFPYVKLDEGKYRIRLRMCCAGMQCVENYPACLRLLESHQVSPFSSNVFTANIMT